MDTFAAADAETADILQGRIADRSRSNYEGGSIKFMLWLHDSGSHANLLSPQLLDRMKSAHLEDQQRRTKKGKPSTSRSSIRAVARASIRGIVTEDTETHPIILTNLTFVVFSRYLSTFKKTIKQRDRSPIIRLSRASFDGAFSALSFIFLECGVQKDEGISKELWTKLGAYKRGSSRRGAQERKKLGVRWWPSSLLLSPTAFETSPVREFRRSLLFLNRRAGERRAMRRGGLAEGIAAVVPSLDSAKGTPLAAFRRDRGASGTVDGWGA